MASYIKLGNYNERNTPYKVNERNNTLIAWKIISTLLFFSNHHVRRILSESHSLRAGLTPQWFNLVKIVNAFLLHVVKPSE